MAIYHHDTLIKINIAASQLYAFSNQNFPFFNLQINVVSHQGIPNHTENVQMCKVHIYILSTKKPYNRYSEHRNV